MSTKFSPEDLERARGRLDIVASEVALRRIGHELRGVCPFHSEKTPTFYVVPEKGFFHCFGCGAHGTAIDFVMRLHSLEFADAVREILGIPHRPPRDESPRDARATTRETDETRIGQVHEVLDECHAITRGDPAHLYLWSRSLATRQPRLYAHDALYCHEVRTKLPALVAPITDERDDIVALQRIWCAERVEYVGGAGPKDARADLRVRKKTLGKMGDGSVKIRLARPGDRLGLAEGVETAIAAEMLFRHPVWATCGVARLSHVWTPPDVSELIIYGDNGEVGKKMARQAASEIARERKTPVSVIFPPSEFDDFNSYLISRPAG